MPNNPANINAFVCADVSCACPADYVGNGDFCNGVLASVLAKYSNFSIFYKVSVSAKTPR